MTNFGYDKKNKSGSHLNIFVLKLELDDPPLLLEIQVRIGEGADKLRFFKAKTTYSSIFITLCDGTTLLQQYELVCLIHFIC